jgi:hypothetical protein
LDFAQANQVLYGRSDGSFDHVSYANQITAIGGGAPWIAQVADIDTDGKSDLVSLDGVGAARIVRVFLNRGNRNFADGKNFATNLVGNSLNVLDANNDGAIDILTDGGRSFTGLRYLLNGCNL